MINLVEIKFQLFKHCGGSGMFTLNQLSKIVDNDDAISMEILPRKRTVFRAHNQASMNDTRIAFFMAPLMHLALSGFYLIESIYEVAKSITTFDSFHLKTAAFCLVSALTSLIMVLGSLFPNGINWYLDVPEKNSATNSSFKNV
jgi:hypothetical protein